MMWNGIGNSLTRWLAVLRLGTASGRATFLWMSDRELRASKHAAPAAARRLDERPPPSRSSNATISYTADGRVFPRRLRDKRGSKQNLKRRYGHLRPEGFDLGDYFVAVGADYRWSRSTYRRVATSMAARFNVTSPTIVSYHCQHHTWACMKPYFEVGPMAPAQPDDEPAALDRGYDAPPTQYFFEHEHEKDGQILSWLAARRDPWLLLRLHEQTALEPSQNAAHAALSGAWLGRTTGSSKNADPDAGVLADPVAAADNDPLWRNLLADRLPTHACGTCLVRADEEKDCVRDRPGKGNWRPSGKPTEPKLLAAYLAASRPAWAQGLRVLRRLRRGARMMAISTVCETYAVLRPRPWLQRAMLTYLRRLEEARGGGPLVGMHMRTGFADWQWYSATRQVDAAEQKRLAASEWSRAATSPPLPYARHWATLEGMMLDCTAPGLPLGTPCFKWRTPRERVSPTVAMALEYCAGNSPALAGVRPLPMPGNGTLAAAVECVHRYALELTAPRLPQARRGKSGGKSATSPREGAPRVQWGVLVLGDAPGYVSLVRNLPALAGRVVETNDAGAVAHTTFTGSCPPNSGKCVQMGTHNPHGGWTRAMIDYYIGGLTDAFVTVLFSSFPGAFLRRSLLCCRHRAHFGAMYSQEYSHRDKPMRNLDFLRAMMQTHEVGTAQAEWAAAHSAAPVEVAPEAATEPGRPAIIE